MPVEDFFGETVTARSTRTISINFLEAVTGDQTLHSTTAGTVFRVKALYLQNTGGTNSTDIWKSGSTEIARTWVMSFGADPSAVAERDTSLLLPASGVSWMVGREPGDDLVFEKTEASIILGFVTIEEAPR